MGKSNSKFQTVYEGQALERDELGGWVLFQRRVEYGGKYWMGITMDDVFCLAPIILYQVVRRWSSSLIMRASSSDGLYPLDTPHKCRFSDNRLGACLCCMRSHDRLRIVFAEARQNWRAFAWRHAGA